MPVAETAPWYDVCLGLLWQWLCVAWRWLFVNECSTATGLLSLSFAINSIFTGLSFSRLNLFAALARKAVECIEKSVDDTFLARVEALKKDDNLCTQLGNFSEIVARNKEVLQGGSKCWERVRRSVTIICAILAFIFMAYECKARWGVALVTPYLILLGIHFLWVRHVTGKVTKSYLKLVQAMDAASKSEVMVFAVDDCIRNLKNSYEALVAKPQQVDRSDACAATKQTSKKTRRKKD